METFGNSRRLQFVPGMVVRDWRQGNRRYLHLLVHIPDTMLGAWPTFSHFIITKTPGGPDKTAFWGKKSQGSERLGKLSKGTQGVKW